jgi:deoxyribose-phosphate aldolase
VQQLDSHWVKRRQPVKAFETRDAIQRDATEIDMVLNIREFQQGKMDVVKSEVETLVQIFHDSNVICKVILQADMMLPDGRT